MAAWKCKFCGAPLDVPENGSVAACEYCGTKQTVPKLDDERRNLLLDRAGQFRRSNEYDRAATLYEQAINEGGDDPELFWSLVLCRYGIEYVEDPASRRRIPTVNRTQYSAVSADPDYREAISRADASQREIYEREAAEIDAIQRGILEISQKEEPFDVFICYKESDANGRRTPDSVLAQELYYGLKNEGFKVFFSRITLEDKLGTAYEPYIFSALHSAKAMVVIGTKPEYFNAAWVRNEWSRYLALIKQGEKKVLIPAYRDMDPYNLPDEFAALQAQDMGKLGFMQDLVRGIKKIIGRSAPKSEQAPAPVAPAVAVPIDPSSKGNLLERGFLSLEYKEWKTADGIFEQVLNLDLHEARAYLGKLLAEREVSSLDALAKSCKPIDDEKDFEKALRFADDKYREELKTVAARIRQNVNQRQYDQAAAIPLGTISGCVEAEKQFRALGDFRDASDRADRCAQERKALEDMLQKEAAKQAFNARALRIYSILATFAVLLTGVLFSTQLAYTVPLWIGFIVALLIGGIVACFACKSQKDTKRIGVVAILPAIIVGFETIIYASTSEYGDLTATSIVALIGFVLYSLIALSQIKSNIGHLFIPEGTSQIRLKRYFNGTFSAVTIPATVTKIKDYAFANCSNLSVIYFKGTKDDWKAVEKGSGWISGIKGFLVQCSDGQIMYNRTSN